MIPVAADVPLMVRQMIPWFALGHGVFNAIVMLLFCHQGWLGHLIRRQRMAGAVPPLAAVRRHRRTGPLLVALSAAGFLAGLILVIVDEGKVVAYPLHFSLGLAIVLTQVAAYIVSRTIRAREATGRQLHRILGITTLCLFPVQTIAGLAILL